MKKRYFLLLILIFVLSLGSFAACEFIGGGNGGGVGGGGGGTTQYTVTFDSQGGSTVDAITVDEGDNIATQPLSTYAGFVLKGWARSKGAGAVNFPYYPSDDITLYAIWSDSVTVTFNSCGGDDIDAETIEKNTKLNKNDFIPVREGYVFDGWYSGTDIQRYNNVCSFEFNFVQDITLYAKWSLPSLRFTYYYAENHEESYLTVYGTDSSVTEIEIPDEFDGLAVTSIGMNAFKGFSSLESVEIPTGIKTISDSAFADCVQLEGVTIPESIDRIGSEAFAGCTSFTEFTLPAGLTSLNSMLKGCDGIEKLILETSNIGISSSNYVNGLFGTRTPAALRTVEILAGTALRENAFKDSSLLTTIILPETLTTINYNAFGGCSALTTINLPDSLTWFMSYDSYFADCDSLELETVDGYLYYIDNWLVKIDRDAEIINPKFKETTVGISGSLFKGVTTLNAINLPDTLKYIGNSAFEDCTSLIAVTFGRGELSIGAYAFDGCSNITKFYPLYIPKNVVSMNGYVFLNAVTANIYCEAAERPEGWHANWDSATGDSGRKALWDVVAYGKIDDVFKFVEQSETLTITEYIGTATDVTVPKKLNNKTVVLGASVFADNKTIRTVALPEGLTKIPDGAFSGCSALIEADIPSTVTEIGGSAFANCSALLSVVLPQGLISIGTNAFYIIGSGAKFEYLYIPASVTTVGVNIIRNLNVYCAATEKPDGWNNGWFSGTNEIYWDVVGIFSNDDYKYVEYGAAIEIMKYLGAAQDLTIDQIADKPVTQIRTQAFYDNKTLKSVVLPDGLTVLNTSVFMNCTALQSVVLPSGLKEIGNTVFYSCEKLSDINLETGLEKIGRSAFYKTALTSVTIPETVTSIGTNVFSYCSKLTQATLPSTLTEIPQEMFNDCILLDGFVIPETVQKIGYGAFYNCKGLTEIIIPATVSEIGSRAFYGCIPADFIIPSTVLIMGEIAVSHHVYCEASEKPVDWHANWHAASYGATVPIYIAYWDVVGIKTNADYKFVEYSSKIAIMEYLGSEQNLVINKINNKPVTVIGERAFYQNESIVTVSLPETVVSIEKSAFYKCINLTTINLPSGVTILSDYVFEYCESLESLDLTHITKIGQQALNECKNLTVFVPKTVQSIANVGIKNVKMIYCEYAQGAIPTAWASNWNSGSTTVYNSNGLPL